MAENSTIEWTDATWNPITGCSMVSAGCTNCYAMGLAGTRLRNHPSRAGLTRVTGGRHVWTGQVRFNEEWLDQPLRWRRPRRIFVCAHGDLFHEDVPDAWIDRVFAVMALAPKHTFQVLTKRPARMQTYLARFKAVIEDGSRVLVGREGWSRVEGQGAPKPSFFSRDGKQVHDREKGSPLFGWGKWPLPNVWLGTSVEDQATADARIPHLLETPAAVRFLSAEPLLGPVNLLVTDHRGHDISALRGIGCDPTDSEGPDEYYRTGKLDLVIVGGESGPGARPMHPDWARSLRDQCVAAGVAFHFKQWGEYEALGPTSHMLGLRGSFTDKWLQIDGHGFLRVGKKAAGRLLDGRTWDQMPGDAA